MHNVILQGKTKECVREGDWKLVRDEAGKPFELYNLKTDPFETRDLAPEMPEKAREMRALIELHMDEAQRISWKRPPE